ncbi:MAG: lysophospholipid acyltransferase family protein [Methylococcales bacterium]|nr:lysophospholipid acyltransferase family protein [Methylococcales bacterium]
MTQKIIRKLSYGWRLFATDFSFFSFGLAGLILRFLVFSGAVLFTRQSLAANKPGDSAYVFIGLMHRIGIMTYEIKGLEKLNRPGQLIIANHPTLIDIVFLISRIQQAYCIVKESLLRYPFMRGPILNAGYISNGLPKKMIAECVEWLQSGGAMIVFPEGTRSIPGKLCR